MPRTPKIRWTQSQVSRLRSAVASYNAALGHARAAHPEAAPYMPDTMSFNNLRSEVTSARELNNLVNRLKRGSHATAFALVQTNAGDITTRFELNEARIAFAVNERRKSMERRARGIQVGDVIQTGHMRELSEYNLMPSKLKPIDMTLEQLRRTVEVQDERGRSNKADRAYNMYLNYVTALNEAGFASDFPEQYRNIVSMIAEIAEEDPDYLVRMYESSNEALRIEFVYDDFMYMKVRADAIEEAVADAYSEWLEGR